VLSTGPALGQDEAAFARARQEMVERHLKARDIADARVLWAMGKVPRHRFVRPSLAGEAYATGLCRSRRGRPSRSPTSWRS